MNKQHKLYQEDLQRAIAVKGIERLEGKRFLITGATGLIGTHFIDALLHISGVEITACGRSREKAKSRLGEHFTNPRFTFLEHDSCNPFPAGVEADFIVPLASNTHPRAYSEHPVETMLINVLGCQHSLELARQTGSVVLYPSTVEIYGNAEGSDVFHEEYTGHLNLSNARSCYPESKRSAEALCQSYAAEYGVDVRIARLSRVFGPTMLPSDTKASSQFILKALAGEDIVLKSEGTQFFSYTYTTDVVNALLYILLNGAPATPYNIANPACDVHLRDFALLCANAAGKQIVFEIPDETERLGYSIATQAILAAQRLNDIGWQPRYTMQEALERTITILHG